MQHCSVSIGLFLYSMLCVVMATVYHVSSSVMPIWTHVTALFIQVHCICYNGHLCKSGIFLGGNKALCFLKIFAPLS